MAGTVASGRRAQRSRQGTCKRSAPKREAVRNYQFPPCGEPEAIFSEMPLRGNRRVAAVGAQFCRRDGESVELHSTDSRGRLSPREHLKLSLSALLAVTLAYFTFSGQPVLSLAAGSGSALLVEFESALPNLVLQIDGNHILPVFVLHHFQLALFGSDFGWRRDLCFWGFRPEFSGFHFPRGGVQIGRVNPVARNGLLFDFVFVLVLRCGRKTRLAAQNRLRPCHNRILLAFT